MRFGGCFLGVLLLGCACGPTSTGGNPIDAGGTPTIDAGGGDPIDAGGGTIDAGGGGADAAVAVPGHAGTGTVSGGVQAQSPNFKIIGTVSSGDGTAASPNTKHRGGVVGATQEP